MLDTKKMLIELGCLQQGNYIISLKNEGMVASTYINCDPVLKDARSLRDITRAMIQPFTIKGFDFIAAPAVGAIPLCVTAAHVASYEYDMHDVIHPFTEKNSDGNQIWGRQSFAESVRGKCGLVLEDIVTSGGSAGGTCDQIRQAGGAVIGVSSIWNRGTACEATFGTPHYHPLINERIESCKAQDHPHFGEWPLVMDLGHPEHLSDYPGERIHLFS